MRKSVGPDDSFLNKVTLVGYKERGGARAAWGAIAFCIDKGLDFPPWVLCYLAQTAERIEGHLVNRDVQNPLRLWQALGLDQENRDPDAGYDRARDPEEVFEVITTWLTNRECKNISDGANKYYAEMLGSIGSPETVRELFYRGKKVGRLSMYERSRR